MSWHLSHVRLHLVPVQRCSSSPRSPVRMYIVSMNQATLPSPSLPVFQEKGGSEESTGGSLPQRPGHVPRLSPAQIVPAGQCSKPEHLIVSLMSDPVCLVQCHRSHLPPSWDSLWDLIWDGFYLSFMFSGDKWHNLQGSIQGSLPWIFSFGSFLSLNQKSAIGFRHLTVSCNWCINQDKWRWLIYLSVRVLADVADWEMSSLRQRSAWCAVHSLSCCNWSDAIPFPLVQILKSVFI